MRRLVTFALALAAVLAAPDVARACAASASGTWSFEVRLSPRAGTLCLQYVELHHDATCEGEPESRFEVSCGETHRAAVTDDGVYVSVLAPRASHQSWPIVRVFERGPARITTRVLALDHLDAEGRATSKESRSPGGTKPKPSINFNN